MIVEENCRCRSQHQTEINPSTIHARNLVTGETLQLPNDFVFALTGYHTDNELMRSLGIEIDPETMKPFFNHETMDLAGVVTAGRETGKIFIENGRFHGGQITTALRVALRAEKNPASSEFSCPVESATGADRQST